LQRLQLTVQRMLDFYRPSAGAQDGHELGEVVRNVLALLERQLADRKIDVRLELPAELPPVSVQSNQMQQVFMNLLLNSADAMPAGGRISIKAASEARGVEVLISDTGPGIPPEAQPSIFEPFFTTREGGTGLGLTVSYSIVSAHGGTLEYLPRQGPGACFRLFLPRAAEPVEEP
jgi:signal transduction histidine kinase